MAGSEGSVGGKTDLLSWSSIVHRPSEDPEPSSLPSTVDITAFSSTPSVEPVQGPNDESASNSDSDSGSDSEVSFIIDFTSRSSFPTRRLLFSNLTL